MRSCSEHRRENPLPQLGESIPTTWRVSLLRAKNLQHMITNFPYFNVDKTRLSVVQKKNPKVLTLKGKRPTGVVTAEDSVFCCNSTCHWNYHYISNNFLTEESEPSSQPSISFTITYQLSGWIRSEVFMERFKYSVSVIKPRASDPVLFIVLDGSFGHTRPNCVTHKIFPPPYCTNGLLQWTSKTLLTEELRRWHFRIRAE